MSFAYSGFSTKGNAENAVIARMKSTLSSSAAAPYRKRNVNDILIHAPAGSVRPDTYCENVIDFDGAMTIGIVYVGNGAGGGRQ